MFSRMKQLSRFHVDGTPEANSDASSTSSIVPYTRNYSNEKYQKGLQVLQLTPVWEHIIRTRQLPADINVAEVFDEMNERLHDPEWQVRQHALRVLVDLLIVIGDDADMYFSPLIAPLVENLGHDAPAIRKAALDSLRIYIANTNLPETIMLEILEAGLERESAVAPGPRYVIGVILSIPSLIQPVLLTSKRSFILRTVFNVMENKMLQIQYQEIVLKVLMKIREMIGEREFDATLPILMKRDFDLLCKVYQLQDSKSKSDSKCLNYLVEGSPAPSYSIVPSPPLSVMPSPRHFHNYPTYSRRNSTEKTFNVLPPEDLNRNTRAPSFEVIDEPHKKFNNAPKQQFSSNGTCFESESFTQIDKNFNKICENNNKSVVANACQQRSQSMHVYNVHAEKLEEQRKYFSLDQPECRAKQSECHAKVHTYNVENGGNFEKNHENNEPAFQTLPPEATEDNKTSYTYAINSNGTHKKQRCASAATSNANKIVEERKLRPSSHTSHIFELSSKDEDGHGKVIMETEIKLNKDTAVTMRIFETPAEEGAEATASCGKNESSKLCENLEFEIDLEGLDEEDTKNLNVNILTPQQSTCETENAQNCQNSSKNCHNSPKNEENLGETYQVLSENYQNSSQNRQNAGQNFQGSSRNVQNSPKKQQNYQNSGETYQVLSENYQKSSDNYQNRQNPAQNFQSSSRNVQNSPKKHQNSGENYQVLTESYQKSSDNFQNRQNPVQNFQSSSKNVQNSPKKQQNYQNAGENYRDSDENYQNSSENYQNSSQNYQKSSKNVQNLGNQSEKGQEIQEEESDSFEVYDKNKSDPLVKTYLVPSPKKESQIYRPSNSQHNPDSMRVAAESSSRKESDSFGKESNSFGKDSSGFGKDSSSFVVQNDNSEPQITTYAVRSPESVGNRFFTPSQQPSESRRSFVVQNYDDLTEDGSDENYLKSRRVTFGGEIIKMRTPDTAAENSDSDMSHTPGIISHDMPPQMPMQVSQTSVPTAIIQHNNVHYSAAASHNSRNVPSPDVSSDSSDINKPLEVKIPENPIQLTYKRPNTAFAAFGGDMRYAPSPAIFTFPPTSSSEAEQHTPPAARRPVTVSHRSKSATPHRTTRRNSLSLLESRLSPQPAIEVTVMHDLQRSPSISPTRQTSSVYQPRRHYGSCDNIMHQQRELAVQTSFERSHPSSLYTEATQTSFEKNSSDENSNDSTPDSDSPTLSWEALGIISNNALKNLKSQDHRLRSQGFSKLEEALKCSENLAHVQLYLPSLLKTLLSVERHPEIIQQKQRIVTNLIMRLPLENLENNFGRILTGMTKQGGPSSNMIAKSMMTRLPTAAIVTKLLSDEFLEGRTSKFKEHALQMIMFALTIFPSTYFDLNTCAKQAANLAMDRRKRVRQAALDVLAILGQISSSKHVMDAVNDVVKYKVNADEFVSAVRQRLSRKVLPLVGSDGEVSYALELPVSRWQHTANSWGADIDWICAGSGSVSPTSLSSKKRKNEWKTKRQAVITSGSSQHRSTASFSTLDSASIQSKNQSRSFPELHDNKFRSNIDEGPGRFIKMPTKTQINVRFPQMPENDVEITNPYTGAIPKRRKQSPNSDSSTTAYQDSKSSNHTTSEVKVSSPKQLKGILVKSAQPEYKVEAGAPPTPKRAVVPSYPPYPATQNCLPEDSDDSTATHIIEKSEIFNVNGRPKSSIIANKDSVTVARPPSSCGSEQLKFTVEIQPVEEVTIRTPPRTPSKENVYHASQSPSPSPFKSTTPPQSPRYVPQPEPEPPMEVHERSVSPHPFSETSTATVQEIRHEESPPKMNKVVSPMKILPPVSLDHHYNDKSYIVANVPSEVTSSILDSYESTTDNEQYRKPMPVRVSKKAKQTNSGESLRMKKKYDDGYSSSNKYSDKPEKPRDMIVSCFVQLQSSNWEEVMEGIENFVVLSKKHADIVDANLHLMTIELGKQIRNLRSQVARAACQAAGDLFQTHRKTIEPEAEELTANLLHRTSDTNKFLRNDAVKAIEIMTENLPPSKVIHILCFKGATHHNGLVKCATAKLLNTFVSKIGGERIYSMNRETRDKLILTCANLLMEGSLETRNYTKEIFRSLSGHPNYSKILVDVIPQRIYRNIEKALKSLR